jgi:peptide/nickel transport system permease protein
MAATPAVQGETLLGSARRPRARRLDFVLVFSAFLLGLVVVAGVGANVLSPYDPATTNIIHRLKPPTWAGGPAGFALGTDALGRDVLSRLFYGSRVSLAVATASVLLSAAFGVTLGLLSGYHGGRLDSVLMMLTDVQMSFPFLLLAIAIVAVLGPSATNAVIALALSSWPIYVRIVRGEVLSIRQREYVEAARALGAGSWRIIWRAILPNVMTSVLVVATLSAARMVIVEASLSYLGLSVQSPDTSWGVMIAEARDYLQVAWWLALFPGLAISLTVLAISLLGDWLRDRFDSRLRGAGLGTG